MLRSEAVEFIQIGLGFRSDQEDNIISALQLAQHLLETGKSLPWFLKDSNEGLTLPIGDAPIDLPDDFLREAEDQPLHIPGSGNNGEPLFLEKLTLEEGLKRFVSNDAVPGKPVAYSIRRSSLVTWPQERDQEYEAVWAYYQKQEVLTSDIENRWLEFAPMALVGRAGMLMADALRNPSAKAMFQEWFIEAWKGTFAEGIQREEVNDPIRVGGRL